MVWICVVFLLLSSTSSSLTLAIYVYMAKGEGNRKASLDKYNILQVTKVIEKKWKQTDTFNKERCIYKRSIQKNLAWMYWQNSWNRVFLFIDGFGCCVRARVCVCEMKSFDPSRYVMNLLWVEKNIRYLKQNWSNFCTYLCLFVWVYGISTFVGYLMLNPFLYK